MSKVKEFTVVTYSEDQEISVEDVASHWEKRKKQGWIDDNDSSASSEKNSSESDSDDGTPLFGRKPRPPQQEIKWYERLKPEDTLKLITMLMNNHVWISTSIKFLTSSRIGLTLSLIPKSITFSSSLYNLTLCAV